MGASQGVRRLGLATVVMIIVANMVGVGVFTSAGWALGTLGDPKWVLGLWLVGGVIAVLGALCYGALARHFQESGGEYLFLARTMHPAVGFLAGWVSLWAGFSAPIAVSALGMSAYLGFDSEQQWFATNAVATAAILVAGLLHGLRLGPGVHGQNLAVGIKLVVLTGFIVFAFTQIGWTSVAAAEPVERSFGWTDLAVQLMFVSFAYSGWNAAVYVAGEVRDPARNLPRALFRGALTVTVLYLLLNTIFVYSAPVAQLENRNDIAAVAANALGGASLEQGARALVALALFTSVSSMVMIGPRVYAKMSSDGVFPALFARGQEVPRSAVWLQCALAVILVWVAGLKDYLGYVGFTLGLSTAAAVVGLMLVRQRHGPDKVPVPGYPWVPLAFVGATLGIAAMTLQSGQSEFYAGLVTVGVGAVVYFLWARRNRGQFPTDPLDGART